MQTDFLPLDLYPTHLKTINGINFTRREIEIIAFLVSGRGGKTIASSLAIAPKTVEVHIHNVMLKLECNSRESIINFIERSDRLPFVRRHYTNLLTSRSFDESLDAIAKLNRGSPSSCLIIFWKEEGKMPPLVQQLDLHLKRIGFNTALEDRGTTQSIEELLLESHPQDSVIYCLPQALMPSSEQSSKVLFLLPESPSQGGALKMMTGNNIIDLSRQGSYYFMVFEILKKLLPHIDFERIIGNFKKESDNTADFSEQNGGAFPTQEEKALSLPRGLGRKYAEPFKSPLFFEFFKKYKWSVGGVGALGIVGLLLFSLIGTSYQAGRKVPEAQFLGSDLAIPALLKRPHLLQQIHKKLGESGEIQTVALIGMGGSGKTTLARQYAHSQKSSVMWEINAETAEKLYDSFESLAYALSPTDQEKKILGDLKDIRNFEEREGKIIQLVKDKLKNNPNWLLIYDNVEKFSDIQKYFPSDPKFWGKGKMIITTQDTHIQNNSYVKDALWVGELDAPEKLALFMKIMNHGEKVTEDSSQQEVTQTFLEKIPSFPLDISVAAYYIKATNIDKNQYLKYLTESSHEFSDMQKNMLAESSGYTKTRYHIITLSLEKLLAVDKDFADLLLLTSLMDSQNIPREILDSYKGKLIVDNFIYYLKKYSLIMDPQSHPTSPLSHISFHRSTQDISFAYLAELLKLTKDSESLKAMIYALDDYADQAIEQEDFSKMRLMAAHLEKVLNHGDVLTDLSKGLLESKLGSIDYFINDGKSKQMLGDSLSLLERKSLEALSTEDQSRLARSLLHIGTVYTELRLDKEAQEVLEKAIHIYGAEGTKNYTDLSWVLSHLGNVYRRLGNYEKAKEYLQESVHLNKQYGGNKQRTARTLGYLGSVYRGLGFYQKAMDTLEESLEIYNKNYSNDHFRIGWILTQLGNVYRGLGDSKKAKECLDKSLLIFKKYLPENHMSMGLALAYLGKCYEELGDYEKSCDYLEQSLKIHQKHFGENHLRMGWILFHLASTYKAMGKQKEAEKLFDKVFEIYRDHCGEANIETARLLRDMAQISIEKNRLDEAEDFITRSLKILQSLNHIDAYKSLETLGEIYQKQSLGINNSRESQKLKDQALDTFNQALKLTEQNFPKDSVHIHRIRSEIKNIKNGSAN